MSTDTPEPEDGQTPEEELQAATPDAPESEPVAEAADAPADEAPAEEAPAEEAPAEEAEDAAEEVPVVEADDAASAESTDSTETTDTADETSEPTAEEPAEPAAEGSDLPELTLGDGAPADDDEPDAPTIVRGKIDKFGVAMGTGRRKTSVARVRIKDGDGQFVVNGKPFEEYFAIERDRKMVQAPLAATESRESVDVWVRVNGGGTTGQTGAVVLGIARALEARNPSHHHALSHGGFLTRDGRMVERKKYGRRKARRSFQFSKR